ncbi:MAG: M48 family metalloprotease [Saprospiraceae bacterium]|nr:M48 family metalloprotease [Candidatus Vicinibacter affinis]
MQFRILYLILLGLVLTTCSRNPVTGKKELSLMSESQEKALGLESDPQIQAEFGMYADSSWQRFLREKGQAMAKISHRPTLGFQFRVIDSEVVNAFAVPGGYVYFTRGILAHFNDEAQLMGVLGHEIGHITAKHANEQYTKQTLAQIGFAAGMILSPQFRQFGNLANTGIQLMFLKFSRDNETQSDKLGVEYSSKVGYDAHHMADFFQTLGRVSDAAGARIPSFLSTHPDPGNRFSKVNALATEVQKQFTSATKVERNSYLKRLEGMVYGADPRQGYKENDIFYHPELKFQYPTPREWTYQNSPAQVQFASKDQKAVMIFTLASDKDLASAVKTNLKNYNLNLISQENIQVNGMSAIRFLAEQVPEQNSQGQTANSSTLRVVSTLIKYDNLIYNFIGAAAPNDFGNYESYFIQSMNGFKTLTDQTKINVKPDRLAIKSISNRMTLKEALKFYNQDAKRYEELAILNGLKQTDVLEVGTLIKTVNK